jgi:hypothetical protein
MSYSNLVRSPFKVRPSNERARLITELASLLWDETRPAGQEAVPEDRWTAILAGPCKGDSVLLNEVCAHERWLRGRGSDLMQFYVPFDQADFEQIVTPLMCVRGIPLQRLYDADNKTFYPEGRWDELLSGWTPPTPKAKERLKKIARWLSEDRRARRFRFKLPVDGVFRF